MRCISILILLISSASFGQTITIIDSTDSRPIEGVFISSKSNPTGILTNEKGQASLASFQAGEYLKIMHSGFNTVHILKENAVNKGTLLIAEKAYNLNPVYIDHPLRYFLVEEDEAGQIQTIPSEIALLENPGTTADLLQNSGNVLVQKSQRGGGSPIIRGFEANKLLLVIDGVRMNNAIYRSGHLQNSITIDNAVLDHTEIIFGPSSSLYGSDALGGVMHFHTKNPELSKTDTMLFSGSSFVRYNSNDSRSANFNFSMSKNNWGLLSSFTASQFNDTRIGTNRTHGYSDWGLHPEYAGLTSNGLDTVLANSDPRLQKFSGYTQFDFLEKFVYEPSDKMRLTLNFQYSTSTNVYRYDKLTEYRNGTLRWAEWYYGPQNRLFSMAKLDIKPEKSWANSGTIAFSYQRIDEDRISRRFGSDFREHQEEDVHVLGLNLDFNKLFSRSRMLFYGLEVQHNIVNSTAYEQNIFSTERNNAQTRYPDFSNYLTSGAYIEYKQKFSNRAVFSAGFRYSFIMANSEFRDTSFINLPFNEVNFMTSAPSGHVGIVLKPDTNTLIKPLITTGFRAPNVDDYGKVFENSGFTVVPNDNIKPAFAIGSELTLERNFFDNFLKLSSTVYSTYLFNAIVRRDFQLNGQDSISYNGQNTKIQANVNTARALVYGVSATMQFNFTKNFNFLYTYNFTKGTDLSSNSPMSHIPPQFGKIAFTYADKAFNGSLYTYYNFRKNLCDYGGGPDNLDLTPNEEGTPPWWTLNIRIGYHFLEHFTLQFAVENILDVHYRQFASGISAPGRNFIGAIRFNF
ncbi:MAG: TonB-dependent receptor [Crocinitomicaceae bacterium]|nr:TonB-dependent receptor [Crocinitomicaceae bacterium]